ncbi:MAG: hypothetical protein HQK83_19715 [Fibrobacteria bacterium]|nr:hypothetical protein [Fibrobacteria bacterium]
MKIMTLLAYLVLYTSSYSYDWGDISAYITVIEPTYMPGKITFQVDEQMSESCPEGSWLTWQGKGATAEDRADNAKSIMQVLLSAHTTHTQIRLFGNNNGCTIDFIHLLTNSNTGASVEDPNSNTFIDARDNRVYKMVTIGTQTWMAENLNYSPSSDDSRCYDRINENCDLYGHLYSWDLANSSSHGNGQDICPIGWHLSSDNEWSILEDFVGGSDVAAKKLRAVQYGGTDDYGFSILLAGSRDTDFEYYNLNRLGFYWTSGLGNLTRLFTSTNDNMMRGNMHGDHLFSVRCVKN